MERYPIPEDHLLAELDWVRAIARQLVTDAGLVDDVVQETWLVAATRPPRARSGRGLKRWLARVTRSIAVRLLRGERERLRRERESARPEGLLASPPDILELATMQKQLMAAVLELEEPYRSAVLMRYLEELTPDEIAARQGTSSDNARQRVSRGLASVRRRLEREWTERQGRHPLMLAFYLPERADEPATALHLTLKWLAAAAVVVLALGAGWRWRASGAREHTPATAITDHARAPADSSSALAATASAAREPLRGVATLEPAPEPRAHRFRGRIVDVDSRPLPGATIELPILPHLPPAHCDADGRFEFVVREVIPIDPMAELDAAAGVSPEDAIGGALVAVISLECKVLLIARADGHAPLDHWIQVTEGDWIEEPPSAEHALGEFVLARVGSLTGRLRADDGTPLAGSPVSLTRFEAGRGKRFDASLSFAEVQTDADGRFLFESVPEGLWRVFGGGRGLRWTPSGVVRFERAAPATEVELVVARADPAELLHGEVRLPDGRAAAGTQVLATPSDDCDGNHARSLCDENGEFELEVTAGVAYDVSAYYPSPEAGLNGMRQTRTLRGVRPGAGALELWLADPRVLALVVHDATGRPVTLYEVHMEGSGSSAARGELVIDAAGRGRFELPDHPCRVILRAEGFRAHDLGLFEPEGTPGERTVRLVPLAHVRGRVRAGGCPLAEAAVEIARVLAEGELELVNGFPSRLDRAVYRRIKTDVRGEFELPILAAGNFALRAEAGGWAALEVGPRALDPGRDERIDLELTQGGTVVGRVLVAPGEDPSGYAVQLARGDGHVLRGVSDAAGYYSIDHLTPGRYMLSARRERHGANTRLAGPARPAGAAVLEFPWSVEVTEGGTTVHDIDLVTLDIARLSGSLRVDGEPYGFASLRYLPGEWNWSERFVPGETEQALAGDGSFAFDELRPGPGWLVLGLAGALDGLLIVRRIELGRGANETNFELAVAEVRGRVPAGTHPLALLARLDGTTFALAGLEGRDSLLAPRAFAAAGEAWLVESGAEPDPFAWRRLAALALHAGKCAVLE